MAAKRIYQIAKEFERDEKEIIEFLTNQGIKVGNRLSAISDDTYNMLKAKYTAPPEPEPELVVEQPAPAPTPQATSDDAQDEQAQQPQGGGKKKKKRAKGGYQPFQGDPSMPFDPENQGGTPLIQPAGNIDALNTATRDVYTEAIVAGNEFIEKYRPGGMTKKQYNATRMRLSPSMDSWAILCEHVSTSPDSSPVNYWQGINKLATKAFKLINLFGIEHREKLAKMREVLYPVGLGYTPREVFTDEENKLFAEQQTFIFKAFSHGMGAVNDRLYELKMYAERMKFKYGFADFVDYLTNPENELNNTMRVPFREMAENITFNISGIARRYKFFFRHEERIAAIIQNFFEWLDGYAKLKESGAPAEKIEKYFALLKKFFALVEFFSFDNLVYANKGKPKPFEIVLELLNNYRDNMDDPDAERNFKYKIRGVTNIIFKPKEYVFLYQFGGLEPHKDYRPPEEIAAAKAAKAAEAAEAQENPADDSADEA